ncbi:MAG TPA: hypothetical protein VHD76_12250 [Bryobacteraceae bacterium]|jgi:hypothetical protein|nr:hypothetical protein [Bryobacteraceae bacterium]
MEQGLPLAINIILSMLSSAGKWPVDPIAGFEGWPAMLIALMAGVTGTLVGTYRRKPGIALLIGIAVVPAVFGYTYYLSRGGISRIETLVGLFLYFYLFFAVAYGLTCLEIIVMRRLHKP